MTKFIRKREKHGNGSFEVIETAANEIAECFKEGDEEQLREIRDEYIDVLEDEHPEKDTSVVKGTVDKNLFNSAKLADRLEAGAEMNELLCFAVPKISGGEIAEFYRDVTGYDPDRQSMEQQSTTPPGPRESEQSYGYSALNDLFKNLKDYPHKLGTQDEEIKLL